MECRTDPHPLDDEPSSHSSTASKTQEQSNPPTANNQLNAAIENKSCHISSYLENTFHRIRANLKIIQKEERVSSSMVLMSKNYQMK
jgi:hypothetical protein